ncbi:MAG TPA: multicopper oxidase [Casimicrobiaceae bacterium]
MITRRVFLRAGAAVSGVLLSTKFGLATRALAAIPGGTLGPATIPKFRMPLIIPPVMPRTGAVHLGHGGYADYYEIAVRQFQQQILPPPLPRTTVWSYGSANHPGSFNYPAFTLEASWRRPVRIKWINELKDPITGNFLPHLLPVDPTLHWANPPGGIDARDMRPTFAGTPGPYAGPVPMVTHLHGSHSTQESDGFPQAWFLPAATNIPAGFATEGSLYEEFKAQSLSQTGVAWEPGTATFQYANDQRATALWYHDHTLGMTRLNVYAGPAGFYLLRGGPGDAVGGRLPGPAPAPGDPPSMRYYEIPIVIQDRAFNIDGSLFYPDSREFFDGFAGPYIPGSDIAPIWNPEFFGNTLVVNGRAWPYLEVEPRRYRLRLLNGCNSRFLILELGEANHSFWQIGADGGFLPAPVESTRLLLGPAERADVIVDFSGLAAGTEILLRNIGPDEPFGGGQPGVDFPSADPDTTGQVMQFRIVARKSWDASTPPHLLRLPRFVGLGAASNIRRVSLNEVESAVLPDIGPRAGLLGTVAVGQGNPLMWDDAITENPALDTTEVWEIHNFTEDAHPIHLHQVQFQVVDRQPFEGAPRPPERWEAGTKDTVVAYPGEITRVRARFDLPGLYVWHCHILEHEDNEMMRPYFVGPMAR